MAVPHPVQVYTNVVMYLEHSDFTGQLYLLAMLRLKESLPACE